MLFVHSFDWAALVVDEAHRLKNQNSLLYETLTEVKYTSYLSLYEDFSLQETDVLFISLYCILINPGPQPASITSIRIVEQIHIVSGRVIRACGSGLGAGQYLELVSHFGSCLYLSHWSNLRD